MAPPVLPEDEFEIETLPVIERSDDEETKIAPPLPKLEVKEISSPFSVLIPRPLAELMEKKEKKR